MKQEGKLEGEYVKLDAAQAKVVVDKLCRSIDELANQRLSAYAPVERWLIFGRAINMLFAKHYQLAAIRGESELLKTEMNYGKAGPKSRSDRAEEGTQS